MAEGFTPARSATLLIVKTVIPQTSQISLDLKLTLTSTGGVCRIQEGKRLMIHSPESLQDNRVCAIDKSCCGGGEPAFSCTLNPAEMPERLERWRTLFAQVLKYTVSMTLAEFRFASSEYLRGELTELVKLEQVCCAHIYWELSQSGDQQILTLFGDEQALPKLTTLLIPSHPEGAVQ